MAIIPSFNFDTSKQINTFTGEASTTTNIGRSFLFDFETGKFVIADGKLTEANQREALEQWISLDLRTYKNKFKVYKDTGFYCDVEDIIGEKPNAFVMSELRREMTESLLKSPQIKTVKDITLNKVGKSMDVNIAIELNDESIMNYSTRL